MRSVLPPLYLIWIFLFAFFVFYANSAVIVDSDTAWHIAAGDLIRASGTIVHPNLWSFSAPDAAWHNISWGWDVLISLIYHYTGAKGLFVFGCSFRALIIAALGYSLAAREGVKARALYIIIGLGVIALLPMEQGRPQNVSYLMLVLFQHFLHRSREGRGQIMWLLPLLMLAWVNMHGGFIGALFLFAAYGVEALYTRRFDWLKTLVLSGMLCLGATLINPEGWVIYAGIYENTTSVITGRINEWGHYVFRKSDAADVFLIVLLLFADFRNRRAMPADKMVCLLWLLMALSSMRHFPIATLLSAPFLVVNIGAKLPKGVSPLRLPCSKNPKVAGLAAGLWVLAALVPVHSALRYNLTLNEAAVPVEEIAFIRNHMAGKKIMNEYPYGGYLIWLNAAQTPVFVDGRAATAYPEAIMQQQVAITDLDLAQLVAAAREHKAEGAIFANKNPLLQGKTLPENWRLAFRGKVASVYAIGR